ncbi:hypothetical protein PM082_021306 [Marasmius tenuissimus]|nr:hypothetical protein PM082_021306 [Marasmius tenuissimus]
MALFRTSPDSFPQRGLSYQYDENEVANRRLYRRDEGPPAEDKVALGDAVHKWREFIGPDEWDMED